MKKSEALAIVGEKLLELNKAGDAYDAARRSVQEANQAEKDAIRANDAARDALQLAQIAYCEAEE